jgi:hypothetical protein
MEIRYLKCSITTLMIITSLILFCFVASKYYCHQCRLITGAYLRLGLRSVATSTAERKAMTR